MKIEDNTIHFKMSLRLSMYLPITYSTRLYSKDLITTVSVKI